MDTIVFWFTKLAWMLLSPDSLFLLCLVGLWLMIRWGWTRAARRLLMALIVVLAVVALLPVHEWMFHPLERRFPAPTSLPESVDGIILLGGAEEALQANAWGGPEVNQAAERYLAFLMLARTYPDAKLVFTGGSHRLVDQALKEADVAVRLLTQQGLDTGRLVVEREARNTAENVRRTRELFRPAAGEKWVLVTSAYHMPRAAGSFCRAGWPVIAYPVDHRSVPGRMLRLDLDLIRHAAGATTAAREWIGLASYYLGGKTEALLPAPCVDAPSARDAGT
ncbi:YdcF family protein [Noviherbaspirillum aridicola]|uniref:DUF218 domain-containing protein n=1 Tax=Noviherbaspirillum aridicola TaxID=2849687 RepID=A0ABQ4Q9L0_9BURK|nr:YdcF family protein [Noviherbaspirillum aridicola]GIZ53895.1 hypothetical protein NCCP691_39090 [Noviherbaspirillum aridicola]